MHRCDNNNDVDDLFLLVMQCMRGWVSYETKLIVAVKGQYPKSSINGKQMHAPSDALIQRDEHLMATCEISNLFSERLLDDLSTAVPKVTLD